MDTGKTIGVLNLLPCRYVPFVFISFILLSVCLLTFQRPMSLSSGFYMRGTFLVKELTDVNAVKSFFSR